MPLNGKAASKNAQKCVLKENEERLELTEVISIEREYHAFIHGPFDETLSQLQKETGAKIIIPPYLSNTNEISISGDQYAINLAKQSIDKIYNEKKLSCEVIPVLIKKSQQKYINDKVLNDIFKATNVSIELPTDLDSEQITLRGEPDKLGSALKLLFDETHNKTEFQLNVKRWIQRHLIGVNDSRLKKLKADFPNVNVSFSPDDDLIKLDGPILETKKAVEIFLKEIDQITENIKIKEINVDPIYHHFINGKKRKIIKNLCESTGAQINMPDQNSPNSNIITIEGNDESIAKAIDEIDQIIKKAIEQEVTKDLMIDQASQLIKIKEDQIEDIRKKFKVFINYPKSSIKIVKLSIRGQKQDVEDCYTHLSKLNRKLLSDKVSLEFLVTKKFLKLVASKDNSYIKDVMDETKAKVDLPNESSKSNLITVSGNRDNCNRAKSLLLKIELEELGLVEVNILMDKNFHNRIINENQRLTKLIQEKCDDVQVFLPLPNSNLDKLIIRGSKKEVLSAFMHCLSFDDNCDYIGFEDSDYNSDKLAIDKNVVSNNVGLNSSKSVENEISVVDKKENDLKNKKDSEKAVKDPNIVEITVQVPQKYHAHFIGKRIVNEISKENNSVDIKFPKKSDGHSDKVIIKGKKKFVESAKLKILDIVEKQKKSQKAYHEIEIDAKYHGLVIGANGCNVNKIGKKHFVRIDFPRHPKKQEGQPEPIKSNKVRIFGKKENCEKAGQDLLDLLNNEIKFYIPLEYNKKVIGIPFLQMLEDKFGIKCWMTKEKENNVCFLKGIHCDIQKAKESIEDKIKELEQQKFKVNASSSTITENKTQNKIKSLPKINGTTKNDISETTSNGNIQPSSSKQANQEKIEPVKEIATVKDSEKNSVKPGNIEKIIQSLESIATKEAQIETKEAKIETKEAKIETPSKVNKIKKDLKSIATDEVYIKWSYNKIIGKNGQNVKELTEQFEVDIKCSSDGSNILKISGDGSNVAACKAEILKRVKEEEEEDEW